MEGKGGRWRGVMEGVDGGGRGVRDRRYRGADFGGEIFLTRGLDGPA